MFYLVRLEISGVEASDAGTYKAVARNATGEGHATINLTFEEGEQANHVSNLLSWVFRHNVRTEGEGVGGSPKKHSCWGS